MTEKRKVNTTFIERLKLLMKEKNVTQQALANALKISRKTISLWCIGKGFPDSYNLNALLSYFGVSKEWIIGESDFRNETERFLSKCNEKYNIDLDALNLVEIIEAKSQKNLYFEDKEQFDSYIAQIIDYATSLANEMNIEMKAMQKTRRRKRTRNK